LNRRVQPAGSAEIARAALALIDEEGIDALSMRRLADHLGIGTMTLYGYFRSKRELLDAAVGLAVQDFNFPHPETGGFREKARAHVDALRQLFEDHPSLPQVRGRQPILHPGAFRLSEPAMQILLDAGFPPKEAAAAFRLLFTYVFGAMLFGPAEPPPAERRVARAALHLLPEDEFPALTATADAMAAAIGGPEQFDYGLERLLDGLEMRLDLLKAANA
jgi:AcrR family transcriptional regulator